VKHYMVTLDYALDKLNNARLSQLRVA
jgi:hypothetical protein